MKEARILKSEWPELREQVKQHWKALTTDELNWIDGHFDMLVDLLQEKYSYSKPLAEDDVKRFVRAHTAERIH